MVLNSLNFCLSGKLLISLSNLKKILLGRVFLVVGSSLSSLWIYHAIPFWLVEFLLRNQLIAWWTFACMLFVIFPLLLLLFYLSLIFVSLITVCVSVFLCGFILPEILCTSWTWLTISFPTLGKFLAIISSNVFSDPSFWDPYHVNFGAFNVIS